MVRILALILMLPTQAVLAQDYFDTYRDGYTQDYLDGRDEIEPPEGIASGLLKDFGFPEPAFTDDLVGQGGIPWGAIEDGEFDDYTDRDWDGGYIYYEQ